MTQRAVVLFARTPEAEARAKGLGAGAARLFEGLIAAWLRAAEATGAIAIIACSPDARPRLSAIASRIPRRCVDQTGGTFGEKLANAAISARDFSPVLIAGIDAPPLDLEAAFEALENGGADASIASARDGGVNVIGFRDAPIELLRSFSMDDPSLAARCFDHFVRVYRMASASDIDSVARIAHAVHERAWVAFRSALAALIRRGVLPSAQVSARVAMRTLPARAPPRF